jgi:hypothetical protein
MQVDDIHARVLAYFLEHVLPSCVAPELRQRDSRPVIVGGVALHKCASESRVAAAMVERLPTQDVDVKFVVLPPLSSTDDTLLVETDRRRHAFVKRVLAEMRRHGAKIRSLMPRNITPMFFKFNKYVPRTASIRKSMLIPINVHYRNAADGIYTYKRLLDTTIYSSVTLPDWLEARTTRPRDEHIVPYVVHRELPFATCEWILTDTMHLMLIYTDQVQHDDNLPFDVHMLLKYIAKLAIIARTVIDDARIEDVFNHALEGMTTGMQPDAALALQRELFGLCSTSRKVAPKNGERALTPPTHARARSTEHGARSRRHASWG